MDTSSPNNFWDIPPSDNHTTILQDHHLLHQTPFDRRNYSKQFFSGYPPPFQTDSPATTTHFLVPADANTVEIEDTCLDLKQLEEDDEQPEEEELGAMKEMMFKIAAMQPVDIDPATVRKPKRRNVRISDDPQSVAARHRRERISERIRILQRLVPGGTKMDTASMLDEAIRYVKFLKRQIRLLQGPTHRQPPCKGLSPPPPSATPADVDWAALGGMPSFLFGGNTADMIDDHGSGNDYRPMSYNPKFINQ